MQPDHDVGMQSLDEQLQRLRLGFAHRCRTAVLRAPFPREVAVQIDPVGVAPDPGRGAVRVGLRNEPHLDVGGDGRVDETTHGRRGRPARCRAVPRSRAPVVRRTSTGRTSASIPRPWTDRPTSRGHPSLGQLRGRNDRRRSNLPCRCRLTGGRTVELADRTAPGSSWSSWSSERPKSEGSSLVGELVAAVVVLVVEVVVVDVAAVIVSIGTVDPVAVVSACAADLCEADSTCVVQPAATSPRSHHEAQHEPPPLIADEGPPCHPASLPVVECDARDVPTMTSTQYEATRQGDTMGLDATAIDGLIARAKREVDEGLLPSAQVALAYDGELVMFETFGDATPDTRYVVYSATKAFVAGAMWALIGDGLVDVQIPRGRLHPGIRHERQGRHHGRTGDAPHVRASRSRRSRRSKARPAPGRCARFAEWRLNWEPGSQVPVPPDLGSLGARRDHRACHRPGLPRRGPGQGDRSGRPARRCSAMSADPPPS